MTRLKNDDASLARTIDAIQALDLGPIKFKATRREDGYGWSAEYADRMEIAYKRYLILHAKYPNVALAPERDIDRFWHMHILDTRKYAADCQAIFGRFLHHFPYLGLRGEDDARALAAAFDKLQALYAAEFGEPVPSRQSDAAWCSVEGAKAAWCSAERPSAKASAWCSAEQPPAEAAWCSVERRPAEAAWCSVERRPAEAAWCSVEQRPAEAAWCSVEPAAKAAWCSVDTAAAAT